MQIGWDAIHCERSIFLVLVTVFPRSEVSFFQLPSNVYLLEWKVSGFMGAIIACHHQHFFPEISALLKGDNLLLAEREKAFLDWPIQRPRAKFPVRGAARTNSMNDCVTCK